MIQGKTESGFVYELEDDVMDNMELVDAMAKMQDDSPLSVSAVIKLVLGEEQRQKLYDHVRLENGRVPASKVFEEIKEIINSFGKPAKNS